jgi:hypothetical protein
LIGAPDPSIHNQQSGVLPKTASCLRRLADYYRGTARDIRGKLINRNPSGSFNGVAVDPDDPPLFESQATTSNALACSCPESV